MIPRTVKTNGSLKDPQSEVSKSPNQSRWSLKNSTKLKYTVFEYKKKPSWSLKKDPTWSSTVKQPQNLTETCTPFKDIFSPHPILLIYQQHIDKKTPHARYKKSFRFGEIPLFASNQSGLILRMYLPLKDHDLCPLRVIMMHTILPLHECESKHINA